MSALNIAYRGIINGGALCIAYRGIINCEIIVAEWAETIRFTQYLALKVEFNHVR